MTAIRIRAERAVESGEASLARWWSKKYNLPPNHELFVSQPWGVLQQEMVEDLLLRRREIENRIEEEGVVKPELLEELNTIKRGLGEKAEPLDPLTAKWERELAEGKIPNLDETMEEAFGEEYMYE